jgi:sugar phosphate isomerase/epimerase
MNLGCSTAFYKESLEGACARIEALGFEWIDLICIPGWSHVQPERLAADFEAEADRVERLLDRHGLRAHAFNMAVPHPHLRADPETNRARLDQTRALVRLMRRLGVARAGFYPGYYAEGRPRAEVVADTAASVREMLEIAGEAGVVIGPEIHRFTPFETPAQARELIAAVPELRVVYDASHFVMQGIPLAETGFLMERAIHVHFRGSRKDVMQCRPEEGTADFAWMVGALRTAGYAFHASIEYIPKFEGDVEAAIRETRAVLEAAVG